MALNPRVRRIQKELADMHADNQPQVNAVLAGSGNDMGKLKGSFKGPEGTPYEGGEYIIDIDIPSDYPFKPPKMKFFTKIWHPNVSSQTGAICLDTLGTAWSPVLTIRSALLSLQSLLSTPEPKDPQDAEVATMLLRNPKQFAQKARDWTGRYAGAPQREDVASNTSSQPDEGHFERQAETRRLESYRGFNPEMIDGFVEMGFDQDRVVEAFDYFHVPRTGATRFELDPELPGAVLAHLLNES